MDEVEFKAGSVPFTVRGETFATHYRIAGDLGKGRPLVALHGGPGVPSNYMDPFGKLAEKYGIPVILYDQFGCGASLPSRPKDRERFDKLNAQEGFWSVELFIDELDNLLNRLGIADDFDLLGQSWGGMLSANFVIDRQPKGLKHLVLADTMSETADWVKSSREIIEEHKFGFPREFRNIIKFAEKHDDLEEALTAEEKEALRAKNVTLESPLYKKATFEFAKRFDLRLNPWPERLTRAMYLAEQSPVQKAM